MMMKSTINADWQTELTARAIKDPDFATQLLENPKETLSSLLNIDFPSDLDILIHQESPNKLHIVLPDFNTPQKSEIDIVDDEILAGCTWGVSCQSSSN
ncbi:MAG: hypothetical protein HCA25_13975 [Dolichospermum sp. DET50]|nr:hypothetical protein [Dolichospermum sp. DET66]MBS3033347.1 hypothetical protein [Dolichospermum sp. DET67]MBS3038551.1 hypothetical protein [Dolichospermum sp. DET50]QSX70427.1 MAG: hypothetical protein EZY12_13225 [Dolichospermum sp. DET69]